jgi:protein-S-isoprenylcysteine O-methyltransferase Ste14
LSDNWVINGWHIADGVRNRILCEIYVHSGLGIFFTLLALECVLGGTEIWIQDHIYWLRILGFALYVPAAIFVFGSMIELHRKGKAKDSNVLSSYGTTVVVERGVFRVVRHPMWLGMSIWSVVLILVSQSVLAIVLGIVTLNHFRMAAVKETEFNIGKFLRSLPGIHREGSHVEYFRGLRR